MFKNMCIITADTHISFSPAASREFGEYGVPPQPQKRLSNALELVVSTDAYFQDLNFDLLQNDHSCNTTE